MQTATLPAVPSVPALPAYRVQIGDVLEIKFLLNAELNETVTVRPDGMISTAVAEDVLVYNRTIREINTELKSLYAQEVKRPRISTIVRSFAPTRVYVSGEVVNPGELITVGPNLTLTQAIARAGGVKNSGRANEVLVIRRGAGDQPQLYMADYDAATQGGDPTKDARLAPFDVVFVPKIGAAEVYAGYQQYLQQFISPSFGVSGSFPIK